MQRVRVMFINCPTLAVDAASFLILAQNREQDFVEFEVAHHWIYGSHLPPKNRFERNADRIAKKYPWFERFNFLQRRYFNILDLRAAPYFKNALTHQGWYDTVSTAVQNYDDWFATSGYRKFDSSFQKTIVITETAFEGGYLGYCRTDHAVLCLANWKIFFSPGSALEFILGSVQRYALRFTYGAIGSHYVTKGCIWDFDVHQPDTRIAAYLGHLCSTCRTSLSGITTTDQMQKIEKLIRNDWVGLNDSPSSVSSVLRKIYRYPLHRSAGLNPSFIESISQGMKTELGKFVIDILKIVLAALGTLYIASQFPEAYRILHGGGA